MQARRSVSAEPPEAPTILVVEDEVLIRADLSDILRTEGYRVIEAANADKAVEILETALDVQLVCTDVRMPGSIDGIGLARWIKANRPSVPVIVISGETTARAMPKLADATFSKPVDTTVLIKAIKAFMIDLQRQTGSGS